MNHLLKNDERGKIIEVLAFLSVKGSGKHSRYFCVCI